MLLAKVFLEFTVKVSVGSADISKLNGPERATSRLTHVVADRLHFLVGHYRLGLSSSPLLGDIGLLTMWELVSLDVRDTDRHKERGVTCHSPFITQSQKRHPVTNYCHIPFIRSVTVNPAHSQKKGITQGCEY